ncbi:MAG TPA: hypothetical protein VGB46_03580 [Flavisolibacter sp.]|jgi:hypothetical protein
MEYPCGQRLGPRTITTLIILSLLILGMGLGCRRNLPGPDQLLIDQNEFTVPAVRQWYFQVFEKSQEWETAWAKGKKYPQWSKGTYQRIGNLEIWEFPLIKEKTKFLVRKDNSVTVAETRKIVDASFSRVLFIRNSAREIVVREVDYIPEWQYLKNQNFDVSMSGYGKAGDDFTGTLVVKDWNESVVSMRVLKNGKITGYLSKPGTTYRNNANSSARTNAIECHAVQYCMWYEDCKVVGDQMTDDCGEPYMDPNDCFYQEECTGEEDDPCVLYGACGDEGGGDGDNPPQPDPCSQAQPGANSAKEVSQTNSFQTSKQSIQAAASDGNEHAVTFGKDANGNVTSSSMSNGGTNSSTVNTNWPGAFADLHNHPGGSLPSAGDLYGLINIQQGNSNYSTRFVVTPDGTVYALLVVDPAKASQFSSNFPKEQVPGFPPDFPDPLFTEFADAKSYTI